MSRALVVTLAGVLVCAASAQAVPTADIEFMIESYDDGGTFYEGELVVWAAADNVEVHTPGMSAGAYTALDEIDPGEWELFTPDGWSLAQINGEMAGTWGLRMTSGSDVSDYSFDVRAVSSGDFPALPTVTYPGDGATGVGLDPTFTWDDNGAIPVSDGFSAGVEQVGGDYIYEDGYIPGEPTTLPMDAVEWTPGSLPAATDLDFSAGYGIIAGDLVSGVTHDGGPSYDLDFTNYLIAYDDVEFTTVPEPASICLLALGGAALLRRRR